MIPFGSQRDLVPSDSPTPCDAATDTAQTGCGAEASDRRHSAAGGGRVRVPLHGGTAQSCADTRQGRDLRETINGVHI